MDAAPGLGHCFPLGTTCCDDGVNFNVFSKHSTGVKLCLLDAADDARPARALASPEDVCPLEGGPNLSRPKEISHDRCRTRPTCDQHHPHTVD